MSDSFTCPFCGHTMPIIKETFNESKIAFHTPVGGAYISDANYSLKLRLYKCPHCKKVTSFIDYTGEKLPSKTIPIYPTSSAKQFPEYVPESVRNDYDEACAIVNLSPKASATLSRRCLQGIIRDFWGISKSRLIDEINSLEGKVPTTQWNVLNSLRRIGNIGAHPEADTNLIIDIEPSDAQKLIAVIELLIKQWYIERHEQEKLYNDILALDEETKLAKKTE